jgi:hypothetical protein
MQGEVFFFCLPSDPLIDPLICLDMLNYFYFFVISFQLVGLFYLAINKYNYSGTASSILSEGASSFPQSMHIYYTKCKSRYSIFF